MEGMKLVWGLVAPKGVSGAVIAFGVAGGVIANINFSDTVTLGSLFTAAVVVIAGGIFSFKNNMRTFWRNLAVERQEEIKVLNQKLVESEERFRELQEQSRVEAEKVAEDQRSLRHDLKNKLAASEALLAAEHAKTDLSALMEQLGQQHNDAMKLMEQGLHRQSRMLQILEATVTNGNEGGQDEAAQA